MNSSHQFKPNVSLSDCPCDVPPTPCVRSLVALASELEYQAVPGEVEIVQSLKQIRDRGCDIAQGCHFAKPLSPLACIDHVCRDNIGRVAA